MTDDAALDDPATRQATLWDVGFARAMGGDPARAVTLMQAKLDESGMSPGQRVVMAAQLHRVGRRADALALLEAVVREEPALKIEVLATVQAFDMMDHWPRERALAMLEEMRRRFPAATPETLEARVVQRLAQREPFLQLRLGDGEGTQIRFDLDDEARHALLYRQNRRSYLDFWFGDPGIVDDPAWETVMDRFNAALPRAECLGGFHEGSIAHAYDTGSRRDVTWVVNTMRAALAAADRDPAWAARTLIGPIWMHYDLLASGAFERLLAGRRVGLVSCHTDLPTVLQQRFGATEIEFHATPGERVHVAELGPAAMTGRHWPDRFRALDTHLGQGDRRGELWLLAAGFPGKLYAERLHAAGAVVLDIGAVADILSGAKTRDFPESLQRYAPPARGAPPPPGPRWLNRLRGRR